MHEWDGEPDSSSVHLHVSLLQGSLCSSYQEGLFWGWLGKNLTMFKGVECGNVWELVGGGGGGGGATRILGISEIYRKKISGQAGKRRKMKAG